VARNKQDTQKIVSQLIDFEKMKQGGKLLRTRFDLPVETISPMAGIVKCTLSRNKSRKFYGLYPGKYRSLLKS